MNTVLARRAGALAVLATSTIALTACAGVIGARMTFDDTEQSRITDIVLDGPGSADVTIRTGSSPATSIRRVVRAPGDPGASYSVSDGVLTLPMNCAGNCSLRYEITAPAGVNVRGQVGSGGIELAEVGAVDLRTGSGDVSVVHPAGAVRVHSGSGEVSVRDAKTGVTVESGSGDVLLGAVAGAVDVRTGSGEVELEIAEPGSVKARSGSGDVRLTVPAGRYRVDTHVGSGDRSVSDAVVADSSAPNTLTVQTGSGDLRIDAPQD